FMERAADLVVEYKGSFSGEHGDGQSRGELLPRMFGEQIMDAFGEVKAAFDPGDKMNPGKVVHPYKLDEHLRFGAHWAPRAPQDLYFSYPEDHGSFVQASARCVGVGNCRSHTSDGQVMCPSYMVTGEEEHSTRGRARLLFEMLQGHPDGAITDGWRSEEVRDALDLCLACKGCKSDCPADVDMATYKAEFLAHHYEGRLRPRADYALGWLPLLAQAIGRLRGGRVVNALSHAPGLRSLGPDLAGLERREVPVFAHRTLQQWWAGRGPRGTGERGEVMIWPDTFTNSFHPHVGQAAVEVLEAAGWRVTIPTEPVCCGLTWISTGQLKTARKVLGHTVAQLAEHVRGGGYVVGLEPSCTAVFRSDAPELLAGDQDVMRLRDQTVTLAELLMDKTPGWSPPRLDDEHTVKALAQVHCHQHAITGWDADGRLLRAAGVDAEQLDSGCCGLAGNFGFTKGHGEVSEACAERVMLPRLRDAEQEAVVLADGFSCRTQIHELDSGGREAVHLAELLAAAQSGRPPYGATPEHTLAERTSEPSALERYAALGGVSAVAGAALVALVRAGLRMTKGQPRTVDYKEEL
ncbi:MAG: (Fe-S)-binding protein, partial [Nocardioidaceae bacterium]